MADTTSKPASTPKSKYQAQWREFDLNQDFWREVFVGHVIKAIGYESPSNHKTVTRIADGSKTTFPYYLILSSGEKIWFHSTTTFPANQRDLLGHVITGLVFDSKGVRHIQLDSQHSIDLDIEVGGTFCIEDGDGPDSSEVKDSLEDTVLERPKL